MAPVALPLWAAAVRLGGLGKTGVLLSVPSLERWTEECNGLSRLVVFLGLRDPHLLKHEMYRQPVRQGMVPRTRTRDRFTEEVCFFCQNQSARGDASLSVSLPPRVCPISRFLAPASLGRKAARRGPEGSCSGFLLSGSVGWLVSAGPRLATPHYTALPWGAAPTLPPGPVHCR